MGKLYSEITAEIAEWIQRQKIFFVATAPLGAGGHVNCSPKGLGSLRVLDSRTVAYAVYRREKNSTTTDGLPRAEFGE